MFLMIFLLFENYILVAVRLHTPIFNRRIQLVNLSNRHSVKNLKNHNRLLSRQV